MHMSPNTRHHNKSYKLPILINLTLCEMSFTVLDIIWDKTEKVEDSPHNQVRWAKSKRFEYLVHR